MRSVPIFIIVVSLLLACSSPAFAQRNTNPANKELPLHEIVKLPGKVVAEAKTTGSTGNVQLTGYRVEEVALPRSVVTEVRGQQVVADKAWRVTVNGGPFPVRAMPAVIWIDDQIVGNGIENETLSQVTAITFDGSLIREGGIVSISYGEEKEGRRNFPQALQLKQGGGNQ